MSKEDIWISLTHENGLRTNFNVKYIEDTSKLDSYLIHFDRISEIVANSNSDDSFVLMGDYNLGNGIEWSVDSGVYRDVVTDQSKLDKPIIYELINVQSLCNLKQLNVDPE